VRLSCETGPLRGTSNCIPLRMVLPTVATEDYAYHREEHATPNTHHKLSSPAQDILEIFQGEEGGLVSAHAVDATTGRRRGGAEENFRDGGLVER
jgi:hypothetical protein